MSLPLPVAFCYVPCQQQIQQYLNKKSKNKKESSTVVTSPVDRRISFFGSRDLCRETRHLHSDQTGLESLWSHLQQDKLWQTVLEYYYSLCNVSIEKRRQAMNVYIKRRVKHKNERSGSSKKCLSYAEIAHKLGILSVDTSNAKVTQQESKDMGENRTESDGMSRMTTCSESGSSTEDSNSAEKLTADGCSAQLPCHAITNDSIDKSQSNCQQTSLCDTMKVPITCTSSNKEPLEKSSQKYSSHKDSRSQQSIPNECRTSSAFSRLNGPKFTNILIDMEKVHIERLSSLPSNGWNISHDLVLVHFLCDIHEKSNPTRCKVSDKFPLCLKNSEDQGSHTTAFSPSSL